jgi:hypothetical protein
MLYYSHFVIASSVTTFRFLTDMQLLYLDAVDHFLNYNSLDHEPLHHGARDHDLPDLEPVDLEPLDHESIDPPAASLPVPLDQDNFAAVVTAVMPEPRLALLEGGRSDAFDGQTREVGWEQTQSAQIDAGARDISDEQGGQEQTGQGQNGRQENGWIGKTAATVVVVAAGAALFEAALLPGLALGVAAIAAPKYVSRLAGALAPILKSTVRATYRLAKTPKAALAGAQQQINGILAEARAEDAHHFSTRAAEELRAAA